MLVSCGAALFTARLAVRSLGYQPAVELLPDPARLRLLARVRLGPGTPATEAERRILEVGTTPAHHRDCAPARPCTGWWPTPSAAGSFASLYTQPLGAAAIRGLIRSPPALASRRPTGVARYVASVRSA